MTSEPSQPTFWPQMELPLTLSPAVSRAKTLAMPETALALAASAAVSGQNTLVLLASYDPASSSWRTSQTSFTEGLASFSETWPRSGMTRNGTAYRLPLSERVTIETDSGLLPTPTHSPHGTGKLNDWGGSNSRRKFQKHFAELDLFLSLSPQWVEWLMMFPTQWTRLAP